jgi:hypothetical protein
MATIPAYLTTAIPAIVLNRKVIPETIGRTDKIEHCGTLFFNNDDAIIFVYIILQDLTVERYRIKNKNIQTPCHPLFYIRSYLRIEQVFRDIAYKFPCC